MNDIKFRVWDKNNAIFHFYDEIFLAVNWLGFKSKTAKYNNPEEKLENYITQQFIGIQDKNGKDIYEGDLVNFRVLGMTHGPDWEDIEKAEVGYSKEYLQYTFNKSPYRHSLANRIDRNTIEVVGNIYENKI